MLALQDSDPGERVLQGATQLVELGAPLADRALQALVLALKVVVPVVQLGIVAIVVVALVGVLAAVVVAVAGVLVVEWSLTGRPPASSGTGLARRL